MAKANQLIALLQSHVAGDDSRFLTIATQIAAQEARMGHIKLANELKELIERAKGGQQFVGKRTVTTPIAKPRGELASVLNVIYSDTRLSHMILSDSVRGQLNKIILEYRQRARLQSVGLRPSRKILLIGPPGCGKTMTASVLAGELNLPRFTVNYEILIGKFMGETSSRLKMIFDAMSQQRGVYFFDEFDAIGAQRGNPNDVGEISRVLNSFLQLLEADDSDSLIVAATNHSELLDRALHRRFDEVIHYDYPDKKIVQSIIEAVLSRFKSKIGSWQEIVDAAQGLSQAEISKAAEDAAKFAFLSQQDKITDNIVLDALSRRRSFK